MSVRRSLAVLGVLIAALAAGAGGYTYFVRPVLVPVSPRTNADVQVFGLGTVEARILSKVAFKVGGVVAELTADHGDRVAKGTVLARLDVREQEFLGSVRRGRPSPRQQPALRKLRPMPRGHKPISSTRRRSTSVDSRSFREGQQRSRVPMRRKPRSIRHAPM